MGSQRVRESGSQSQESESQGISQVTLSTEVLVSGNGTFKRVSLSWEVIESGSQGARVKESGSQSLGVRKSGSLMSYLRHTHSWSHNHRISQNGQNRSL